MPNVPLRCGSRPALQKQQSPKHLSAHSRMIAWASPGGYFRCEAETYTCITCDTLHTRCKPKLGNLSVGNLSHRHLKAKHNTYMQNVCSKCFRAVLSADRKINRRESLKTHSPQSSHRESQKLYDTDLRLWQARENDSLKQRPKFSATMN